MPRSKKPAKTLVQLSKILPPLCRLIEIALKHWWH